jgi:hypothetical protein
MVTFCVLLSYFYFLRPVDVLASHRCKKEEKKIDGTKEETNH